MREPPLPESWEAAAEALAVRASVLGGMVSVGFAALLIAAYGHVLAAGVVASLVGLALVALGLRALVRPARPFRGTGVPWLRTSRRVGGFYTLAGLVWIWLSATTIH